MQPPPDDPSRRAPPPGVEGGGPGASHGLRSGSGRGPLQPAPHGGGGPGHAAGPQAGSGRGPLQAGPGQQPGLAGSGRAPLAGSGRGPLPAGGQAGADPRARSGVVDPRVDPRYAGSGEALMRPPDRWHGSGSAQDARLLAASGQDGRLADAMRQVARSGTGDTPITLADRPPEPAGVATSLAGRRIGPYRITGLIAQGGMGAVYEAVHERLDRAVALKTMRSGLEAPRDEVERFLNEGRAAARLSHRNLVQIHDVGEADGVRYLAMELVRGETLHALVRRTGPLDERRALEIVAAAAEGLHHAHLHGVLHRDLKPANVLIDPDGVPRLTDFGVAKAQGQQSLTATGTALGTPSYMSPEQAMGMNDDLDARTDVWGLGAVLYECLTGHPPFDRGTHMHTMQAVVNEEPLRPSELRPGLSPEVEALCLRCLTKRREQRFASAEALARALRDRLDRLDGITPSTQITAAFVRVGRRLERHARLLGLTALLAVGAAVGAGLAARAVVAERQLERRVAALTRAAQGALDAGLARLAGPDVGPDELAWAAALLGAPGAPAAAPEAALERLAGDALEADAPDEARARAAAALAPGLTALGPAWAAAAARVAARAPDAQAAPLLVELVRRAPAPDAPEARGAWAELARRLVAARDPSANGVAAEVLARLAPGGLGAAGATGAGDRPRTPGALAALRARALLGASRPAAALGVAEALAADPAAGAAARREAALVVDLARLTHRGAETSAIDHAAEVRWAGAGAALFVRGVQLVVVRFGADGGPAAREERSLGRRDLTPRQVAALDRDGDGQDELALLVEDGRLIAARLDRPASGPWAEPLALPAQRLARRLVAGDVDGDRKDDLLVLAHGEPAASFVHRTGAAQQAPPWVHLPTVDGPLLGADLVDLDGDGRVEVLLAVGGDAPGLRRLRWDAEREALVDAGALALEAAPAQLAAWWRPRGARGASAGGGDEALVVAGDAVLLVGAPTAEGARAGAPLEVRARWPLPPGARGARAFGWGRGEAARVGRAAWTPDAGWWLELAGRDELLAGQGREGAAPLLAAGIGLRGLALDHAALAEVDEDDAPELLLGRRVYGVGAAPREPPGEASTGDGGPPALDLDLAARAAAALARAGAGGQGVVAPATAAAALDLAAGRLARAAAARQRASDAFQAGLAAEGRAALAEATGLAAHAEAAVADARGRARAPEERARAAALEARAAADGGDWGAGSALLQAAVEREGPLLPAFERAWLEGERDRWAGAGEFTTLSVEPLREGARDELAVRGPLAARPGQHGLALRVGPDLDASIGQTVALSGRASPLVLEADLRVQGGAWCGRAALGLLPTDAQTEPDPSRTTGLCLLLDEPGGLALQVVVSGRAVGGPLRLAGWAHALRIRLELAPTASGGAAARLWVRDRADVVLGYHEAQGELAAPSGPHLLGLASWRAEDTSSSCCEQARWPVAATVVLSRVQATLPGARPAHVEATTRGHARLALGDPRGAQEVYQALLAATAQLGRAQPDARFHRGIARGRLGDAEAHRDLVDACAEDPLWGLLALEDAVEAAPDGERADLATVGAALRALAQDARPLLAAIGRQLLGELGARCPPEAANASSAALAAAAYLAMRDVHDPARWQAPYARYRGLDPRRRLPRRALPPVLDAPEGPLDEATYRALFVDDGCFHERAARLSRARAARPDAWEPLAALGRLHWQAGAPGPAEEPLRAALERAPRGNEGAGQTRALLARVLASLGRVDEALAVVQDLRAAGATPAALAELEQQVRAGAGRLEGPLYPERR